MTFTGGSPAQRSQASLVAFLLVTCGVLAIGYAMVAPYVITLTMGGILALLVQPLYRHLSTRYRVHPKLAALLITVAVVILVVAPVLALSGMAVQQAMTLVDWAGDIPGLSLQGVLDRIQHWQPLSAVVGDPSELKHRLGGLLQNLGKATTALIIDAASEIPNILLQLFIACLACYFFLLDGRAFTHWLGERLPLDRDLRLRLTMTFKDTAISVIWASTAAAAAQSFVMLSAFAVLGVPAAALAGGATFVFAWIPVLGSAPIWISGILYLYLKGMMGKAVVMLVFGIFTGLLDNFVRPFVLKGRSEMHPLVSLVAIFGGIQMFGIVGILFGPIIAAIVITLLQVWPSVGKRAGLDFAG